MSRDLRKKPVHFPVDCHHFIFPFILRIVSPNKVYWTLSSCNYGDIGVNGNVMCEMVFGGGEMYCLSLQQQQQFLPWDSFQTNNRFCFLFSQPDIFVICRVWICVKRFFWGTLGWRFSKIRRSHSHNVSKFPTTLLQQLTQGMCKDNRMYFACQNLNARLKPCSFAVVARTQYLTSGIWFP